MDFNLRTIYVFIFSLVLFLFLSMLLFTSLSLLSIFGFLLFVLVVFRFLDNLGEKIEIRDFFLLLATLQWLVGPVLSYTFFPGSAHLYAMSVEEKVYMGYVLPATIAFAVGLYFPLGRKQDDVFLFENIRSFSFSFPDFGYWVIGIGILSHIISPFAPPVLGFVFFLLKNLVFIGLFYILLSPRPLKWWFFAGTVLFMLSSALVSGMFHDLLLWLSFMFIMTAYIFKYSLLKRSFLAALAFLFVILIQSIKTEYRQTIRDPYIVFEGRGQKAFTRLLREKVQEPRVLVSRENLMGTIDRFNQGWIISRIMNHTPVMEPYARGETIKEALNASILPRFLAPGKVIAGGQQNFERFTGKHINPGTSMNLSLVGEAYANFGVSGGVVFMFFTGLLFNFVLVLIIRLSRNHPTLVFWIPLIFLQVVKAETDFVTVLNFLVKASLVTWGMFWFFRRIMGIRI